MLVRKELIYLLFLYSLVIVKILSETVLVFILPLPYDVLVYVLSILCFLIIVMLEYKESIKIHIPFLLFVLVAFFSIALNEIPLKFQSEFRLIYFLVLIFIIGPLITNTNLREVRVRLLVFTFFCIELLVVLSFFYKIFNLPQLGIGHFGGVFKHSMVLAPLAALILISRVIHIFRNEFNIYNIVVLLSSSTCLYFAGSRTSLIGCILVIFMFMFFVNFRNKVLIYILSSIVAVLALSQYHFNGISASNEGVTQDRGNTREELWENRIKEFELSPIYGIGFASEIFQKEKNIELDSGILEPGSSYLSVLATTGILGFIFIYYTIIKNINISAIIRKSKRDNDVYSFFYLFFLIHFVAEGYILAAGSFMFFIFWLLIGSRITDDNFD